MSQGFKATLRAVRRQWNGLPRCQKNIFFSLALFAFALLVLSTNREIVDVIKSEEFQRAKKNPKFLKLNQQDSEGFLFWKSYNKNGRNHLNDDGGNVKQAAETVEIVQKSLPLENIEPHGKIILRKHYEKVRNAKKDISENGIGTPIIFPGPTNNRQKAVLSAFRHSWAGYKEHAWGHDNLKPISMTSYDWFGLGLTIVDALDTMYIMNMQNEFEEAKLWVQNHLNLNIDREVNLFEVTIRVLGGLLSAYHLSGDKIFLLKAVNLGERLLPCFNTPSGIPYSDINLSSKEAHSPKWSPDSSTSEVTSIQLEFRDLSHSIGNFSFEKVAQRVNEVVHKLEKRDGLVPIFINANSGTFRNFATVSLGARGDSYYEYLIKQWIQKGRNPDDFLIHDYQLAIEGILKHLVRKTPNKHYTYIGELADGKDFKPKMDHLTCYLPGSLILGSYYGMPETHKSLAQELLETCYQMYITQPTGLAPEITYFTLYDQPDTDIYVKSNDAHNLLRPEFIESLFYFYALTGNKTYQDMGWNIFEAFEKYTKVKKGYTSIGNVKSILNTRPRDMMESFWLSETLKYFYLLFSDNRREVDLDLYVLNTEAHLLPIRNHILK